MDEACSYMSDQKLNAPIFVSWVHTCFALGIGEPAIRQQAIRAPQVVDTTGAGDCFTGAYAVALLEGKKGAEAMRFASAAGSICVRRKGAMPSMPSRSEVEQLLAETPV